MQRKRGNELQEFNRRSNPSGRRGRVVEADRMGTATRSEASHGAPADRWYAISHAAEPLALWEAGRQIARRQTASLRPSGSARQGAHNSLVADP